MRQPLLLLGTLLLAAPVFGRHSIKLMSLRQTVFQQNELPTDNSLPVDTASKLAGTASDNMQKDADLFEQLSELTSPAKLFSVLPGNPIKTLLQVGDSSVLSLSNLPGYSLTFKEPKLCDTTVRQYSGYLNVASDKHFFFWFFESRNSPAKDPLLLWLNGGPGCSSMLGLFMELGPCRINKNGNGTLPNPYSWNTKANTVFLDQPVNVGYSYGKNTSTTDEAAKDVYAFMQLFHTAFPKFQSNDMHVFGESYGGHYVPAVGDEIRRQNKGAEKDGYQVLNLKSIGVGNGLTDPLVQYKYYSKMGCNNTYGPVLDKEQCKKMDSAYPTCANLIKLCYRFPSAFTCVPPAAYCNKRILEPYMLTGYNPYDVRRKCPPNVPLCYEEIDSIQTYLNLPHVMKELGAKVDKFESCDSGVYQRFTMSGDWMRPYVNRVPKLLEDGIRVLIYAGDADFICNWYGNKAWTVELEWAGKAQYSAAKDQPWEVDGKAAGEVRESGPFTFLRIFEAGHMVPYDQPTNSLDMINRWLDGKSYIN